MYTGMTSKSEKLNNEPQLSYSPIETIEELFNYGTPEHDDCGATGDIRPECTLAAHTEELCSNFSDVKMQVTGRRIPKSSCPRTLVCHDFKGGYLDDRYVNGTNNPINYTFRHWLQTDIFCYFSHKFVTIPPIGWINAAHKHGVLCLGTIITECDDGERLCQKLLESSESIAKAVNKLCIVAKHYQFDGYLVNIENELENVDGMLEFVRLLTRELKTFQPNSLVIWYDSVTHLGELKWQNELNNLNRAFFDATDGIYLNYGWNDENLRKSLQEAADRQHDVYVGVDVFGRGCCGGGGLDTYKAIQKVAEQNLSVAIFAPGWSFECHSFTDFPRTDDLLWNRCAKFLHYRTLAVSMKNKDFSLAENNYSYKVYLSTDFNLGFGTTAFYLGKAAESSGETCVSWFNLSEQSMQPVLNCFFENDSSALCAHFDSSTGFLGGGCLRMAGFTVAPDNETMEPVCPVWVPLNIPVTCVEMLHSKCAALAVVAWKSDGHRLASDSNPIRLLVEAIKSSISEREVVVMSTASKQLDFKKLKNTIKASFRDFLPKKYVQGQLKIPDLNFEFKQQHSIENAEINGWNISSFLVDVSDFKDITSLKLGASENIFLGLLSFALLSY